MGFGFGGFFVFDAWAGGLAFGFGGGHVGIESKVCSGVSNKT